MPSFLPRKVDNTCIVQSSAHWEGFPFLHHCLSELSTLAGAGLFCKAFHKPGLSFFLLLLTLLSINCGKGGEAAETNTMGLWTTRSGRSLVPSGSAWAQRHIYHFNF